MIRAVHIGQWRMHWLYAKTSFVSSVTWFNLAWHVYCTLSANYLSHSRVDISHDLQNANLQLCGTVALIRSAGDVLVECEPHRQGRYVRITRLDTGVHTGELRLCQAYVTSFLVRGELYTNPDWDHWGGISKEKNARRELGIC